MGTGGQAVPIIAWMMGISTRTCTNTQSCMPSRFDCAHRVAPYLPISPARPHSAFNRHPSSRACMPPALWDGAASNTNSHKLHGIPQISHAPACRVVQNHDEHALGLGGGAGARRRGNDTGVGGVHEIRALTAGIQIGAGLCAYAGGRKGLGRHIIRLGSASMAVLGGGGSCSVRGTYVEHSDMGHHPAVARSSTIAHQVDHRAGWDRPAALVLRLDSLTSSEARFCRLHHQSAPSHPRPPSRSPEFLAAEVGRGRAGRHHPRSPG